jgi:hypothetical protein
MVARNSARYLAPIALVVTIAGGYLIVHHNLATKPPAAAAAHGASAPTGRRHGGKFAKARFYTVRPNETLTSISDLTGVALSTLETLNPSINPNALQTGQRIRLRR